MERKVSFFFYLALIWIVSIFGFLIPDIRYLLAVVPRESSGLTGIITMHLVHQDWEHLLSNTLPFTVFSWMILVRNSRYYHWSVILSAILTGVLLWILGRDAAHIGASGVIFSLFGLIMTNAYLTRGFVDVIVAIFVFLLYGGLLFGILPTEGSISWEAHLLGVLSGVAVASLLRKFFHFERE